MSFHSRTKRTTNHKSTWDHNERIKKHHLPYLTSGYRENYNPFTGKVTGWGDSGYKDKGLKKSIRRAGKEIIAEALHDMADEYHCDWCGSSYCDNPVACYQEQEDADNLELYYMNLEDDPDFSNGFIYDEYFEDDYDDYDPFEEDFYYYDDY